MVEQMIDKIQLEKTLDPGTPEEWAELRVLAHRMVDGAFDHLQGRREQAVWQSPPDAVRHAITGEAVPRAGEGAAAAYEDFLRDVLPYAIGNTHPRFWGWVMGGGDAVGMMAEMLAAA